MEKLEFKTQKYQKGITLIALVITIIVLLILAGVTIATLTGKNGILEKVNQAKKENEKDQKIEMAELYISEINIEMAKNNNFLPEGVTEIENIPIKIQGIQPNIGWIYIENNVLTKYEFYYDDLYILSVNGDIKIEDFSFADLINVKDFGAVGDGVTDDTLAIQDATNYLNENGGILYFPLGTYYVTVSDSEKNIMHIESNQKIIIDFFCSTILLKENQYEAYNIINANNCISVELRNGFLVGDRKNHDYTTISSTHEFGYGIFFNQTISGEAFNMDISDMTGDAITNKNGESTGTITVNQSDLHHCRRQGISILDSDIVNIKNTKIHHIGTFDNIKGTAPQSGIDIEPASGTNTVNKVSIDNVTIKDTTSFGIINVRNDIGTIEISNSDIDDVNLTNANIKDSNLKYKKTNGMILVGGKIENTNIKLIIPKQTLNIRDAILNNCIIEGPENDIAGRVLISNTQINNTKFKNLLGTGNYNSNSISDFGVIFRNEYNYKSGSSDNRYENCAIIYAGEVEDKNSYVENSYIYIDAVPTILENIEINNCETNSNAVSDLTLNGCTINNSGTFGICKKNLLNTHFSIEEITNGRFPVGSTCNNTTIHVIGNMTRNALNLIQFSNSSKIILDKYNSSVKINNQYSSEGSDYIVEYNGSDVLN